MKSQTSIKGSGDLNLLELKPEWIVKSGEEISDSKKALTLNTPPSASKNVKK